MNKLTNDVLLVTRKSLLSDFMSSKIIRIYSSFESGVLLYSVIVTEKLSDEEFEELRVAQTEVLASFPDGEIKEFIIREFQISPEEGTQHTMPGIPVFENDFKTKLISEEICKQKEGTTQYYLKEQ